LQLKDRESMVPASAACQTRPGIGPGTPYFEDASESFRQALAKIDFEHDITPASRTATFDVLLGESRKRDTLTLWHLLARVDQSDRARLYEKMIRFVPAPEGVTREGVMQLNERMLELWRDKLEPSWSDRTGVSKAVAEAFWSARNGFNKAAKKIQEK